MTDREWVAGVGGRVLQLRKYHRLSQYALAARIGTDNSEVSRWEAGRRMPTLRLVMGMARELDVSLDWLLLGRGTDPATRAMRPEDV